MGGSDSGNDEWANAIAVDDTGVVYVAGLTSSTNFPTTNNAFQENHGGNTDAFVSKLGPDGQSLIWSTYLGGSRNAGSEGAHSIAVDSTGAVYVAGQTLSVDFPIQQSYQDFNAGGNDVFIARFAPPLTENIPITATVPEDLTFTVDATTCDLGNLTATVTSTCTHTMSASTNAKDGYSISYIETETLTSGTNEIAATGNTGANSIVGTNQFGFNLVANTNPSVGDNPVGGVGQASVNYSTPNVFSFNTDGAQIASSTIPSLPTTYTASFMANVSSTTPSGDYSTIVTYIMTANFNTRVDLSFRS